MFGSSDVTTLAAHCRDKARRCESMAERSGLSDTERAYWLDESRSYQAKAEAYEQAH